MKNIYIRGSHVIAECGDDTTISVKDAFELVLKKRLGKENVNVNKVIQKEIDSLSKKRDNIKAKIAQLESELAESRKKDADTAKSYDAQSAKDSSNDKGKEKQIGFNNSNKRLIDKSNVTKGDIDKHLKLVQLKFESDKIQQQIDEMEKCIE